MTVSPNVASCKRHPITCADNRDNHRNSAPRCPPVGSLPSSLSDTVLSTGRLLWGRGLPPGALVKVAREAWTLGWQVMMSQLAPSDASGAYTRPSSAFRHSIGSPLAPPPPPPPPPLYPPLSAAAAPAAPASGTISTPSVSQPTAADSTTSTASGSTPEISAGGVSSNNISSNMIPGNKIYSNETSGSKRRSSSKQGVSAQQQQQQQQRQRVFPAPVPGRYVLYAALSCPWAHRTLIVHKLKGLHSVVPLAVAKPGDAGLWEFEIPSSSSSFSGSSPSSAATSAASSAGNSKQEAVRWCRVSGADEPLRATADVAGDCSTLKQVYARQAGGYNGRSTVPMLWDTYTNSVVNNESADIIRILNASFNEYALRPHLDLEPTHLRPQMAAWDEQIYNAINNGVYKCGFATTQEAYHSAVSSLFSCLDRIDAHVASHRFLCSSDVHYDADADALTLSDIRLFTTLLRFDAVYHPLFKCSQRTIQQYTNIYNYMRDIYQMPGVASTCDVPAVMSDYYGRLFPLNPGGIVPSLPRSLTAQALLQPHNRGAPLTSMS